jgi:alkanesulfonate monooxygenase SsuD/methylene tetrahydromethanopterin reductase-like flavin-dependent oxidoreductase (luciferase family)
VDADLDGASLLAPAAGETGTQLRAPVACFVVLTGLGLLLPNRPIGDRDSRDPPSGFSRLVEAVQSAEEAGFDTLWVSDPSTGGPAEDPSLEAFTLLGALARVTTRVRLGVLTNVNRRCPSVLAKQMTAVDVLSSGRAVLGFAGDAATIAESEKVERLTETLAICRSMFNGEAVHFGGDYYEVDGAVNRPPPVQDNGPQVLVEVDTDDQLICLVARAADGCAFSGTVGSVASAVDQFNRHALDAGRDPTGLSRVLFSGFSGRELRTSERRATMQAAEYREAGINGIMVSGLDIDDTNLVFAAAEILGGVFSDGRPGG